jgi:hypothetical protein
MNKTEFEAFKATIIGMIVGKAVGQPFIPTTIFIQDYEGGRDFKIIPDEVMQMPGLKNMVCNALKHQARKGKWAMLAFVTEAWMTVKAIDAPDIDRLPHDDPDKVNICMFSFETPEQTHFITFKVEHDDEKNISNLVPLQDLDTTNCRQEGNFSGFFKD